mgnify:FL=1
MIRASDVYAAEKIKEEIAGQLGKAGFAEKEIEAYLKDRLNIVDDLSSAGKENEVGMKPGAVYIAVGNNMSVGINMFAAINREDVKSALSSARDNSQKIITVDKITDLEKVRRALVEEFFEDKEKVLTANISRDIKDFESGIITVNASDTVRYLGKTVDSLIREDGLTMDQISEKLNEAVSRQIFAGENGDKVMVIYFDRKINAGSESLLEGKNVSRVRSTVSDILGYDTVFDENESAREQFWTRFGRVGEIGFVIVNLFINKEGLSETIKDNVGIIEKLSKKKEGFFRDEEIESYVRRIREESFTDKLSDGQLALVRKHLKNRSNWFLPDNIKTADKTHNAIAENFERVQKIQNFEEESSVYNQNKDNDIIYKMQDEKLAATRTLQKQIEQADKQKLGSSLDDGEKLKLQYESLLAFSSLEIQKYQAQQDIIMAAVSSMKSASAAQSEISAFNNLFIIIEELKNARAKQYALMRDYIAQYNGERDGGRLTKLADEIVQMQSEINALKAAVDENKKLAGEIEGLKDDTPRLLDLNNSVEQAADELSESELEEMRASVSDSAENFFGGLKARSASKAVADGMNEAWRENLSAANAERARVGEVLKGSGAASAQLAGIGDLQSDSLGRLRMSSERAAEKMVEKEGIKD